jgi:predicted GNAT family acetyltransferase
MTNLDLPNHDIHHDPVAHRFTTRVDGLEAEVNYHYDGDLIVINHTGVPRAIEGRGIGSALVRAVFDFARETGAKVRPACSYAAAWVERHAQYADVLA